MWIILSTIPLLLIIFILIVGFCLGFTTYAIFLKIAVRKGKAFVQDKDGKWQPFDPYIGTWKEATVDSSGKFLTKPKWSEKNG